MAVIIEYTIRGEEGKRSLSLSLRFFVSQCFLSFTHRIIYRRPSAFLSLNQSIHVEINTVVNDFHQDFLNDSIWRSETKQRISKLMLDRRRGLLHHRNDDAQTNRKDKPYLAGYLEPFRGKPNTVVHTHGKNTRLKDGTISRKIRKRRTNCQRCSLISLQFYFRRE